MKSIFDFIVRPKNSRTTNKKLIQDKELILNTELQNHNYVSRVGIVIATPAENNTEIEVGDEVIVHHNVFRRFRDIRGDEKNSKSFFKEDMFFVSPDQIYAYRRIVEWNACKGYNFVKPIKENKMFSTDFEKPCVGVLKFKDKYLTNVSKGDLVGYTPGSEYEFIINQEKLYRVPTEKITIKYEYQGDEAEYNPSWLQSS
jgi:hypothetical protein|tara:strand:+ start:676 stop:1275 length:600 start_codon:yes stop_codon:yes gene_type:complete